MDGLTEHEKDMLIGTLYRIVEDNYSIINLLDEEEDDKLNEIAYEMKQGLKAIKKLKDHMMAMRKSSVKEAMELEGSITSHRSTQMDEIFQEYDLY